MVNVELEAVAVEDDLEMMVSVVELNPNGGNTEDIYREAVTE